MANQKTEFVQVLGMSLPVIKDLGCYALVAHPNGPAVANQHSVWALDVVASADCDLPSIVRSGAIEAYREWSWPHLQAAVEELKQNA